MTGISRENAACPARPTRRPHAHVRRHRLARPAVLSLLRAGRAGRTAWLRVRLDLRLAHPLARVLRDASARCRSYEQDQARPLRDESGHPRPNDHRELVRDDAGPFERPDGDGHRPRRFVGLKPVRVAEFERRCQMIKDLMNGRKVDWNEKELELTWARKELPEIPMWVAGYGPKALAVAGRVGDGVIIQLADPVIIQWIMDTA